ncbi:hypothetical protein SKAU_G00141050 [Synaphobranchus kaupii]|uniref:protein O-GlcNAcase n=1 Tax=Synaphobranchus kaupii TaxID=118154 RepID=A0A9Q1FSM9_SYNKA|nr:hypothetical protein SKAU_G00141050 [Synaphobranchus kaupii]
MKTPRVLRRSYAATAAENTLNDHSCKMAARWGVGEESLNTGNMEFFTTYSLEEGHLSGEGSGLTLDAQLDSAGGLGPFHSCLDPSILSIFEDSFAIGEARGRAEEESEATLLTALTEILDNVDDENLSPFDTLPDSELFSGQRGREPSPLRRLLTLARSPPGREPAWSPKSATPIPAKAEKVGVEWEQKARALPRVPDMALQRSDGEEEEEEGGGGLSPSSEGPLSPDATEAGALLSLDQDGRCVAVSLSDLVKHMHTYCLEVCLEPGEGDGLLPEGAIVLEVVDQGEQGEPVLAVTSSLGLMEALTANEEAGFLQQQQEEEEEKEEQASQQVGGSSSSFKENSSLPASVSEENDDEKASEDRPRGVEFGKYPTGRKKKRKSDEGGGRVPEGRVLRSASANLAGKVPEVPLETAYESKAQTAKKRKRVSFAPILSSCLDSTVESGCGSESAEAPAVKNQPLVLEEPKLDFACLPVGAPAPVPLLPEIDAQPCEAASVHKEAPVSQQVEPEPKPRPLSLQQYRLLRQQKKPAPVVKQEDQSTKWPSLPEPPTELLPIPCLVEPQPQLASKTTPPIEPIWQPVGTEAPPTPQALLVPLTSLGSTSKAAATPAKPASVPKSTEGSHGPNPPRVSSPPLSQKQIEPGACKLQEPSRRSPAISEGVQYNRAAPPQGPLPSTAATPLPSAVGVKHQPQHVPPVQAATQTPKLQAIPIPGKKGVPSQQMAAPTPTPTPIFGPTAPGRPQRATQKRLTPVQMPPSGKRNPRASQQSTNEIGIEATDLTSLLEQFEETQAKEEQRVPALCGRAAAVGNSSSERQPDKKPLERPRGPDLGSTAGLTPPATPPHQVWKPLTPVILLGTAKQIEGAKPSPSKAAQVTTPQLPPGSKAGTPLPPKPVALKQPLVFTDHDYCLPTEKHVESLKGTCYGVMQQPGTAVKAAPPAPFLTEAQRVAATTQGRATPVPKPAKFVSQPLDHRTLTGSVLLSPESSPCRPEASGDGTPDLVVELPRNKSGGGLRFLERPASPRGREKGRTRRQYRGRSSSSESSSSGSSSQSSSKSRSSSMSTSGSRSRSDSRSPPRKRFRSRRSESSSSNSSRSSSRSPPLHHRYSYPSSYSRSWSRSRSRSCSPRDPRHQWWRESCSPSFARRYSYSSRECFQWQDVKDRKEKAIEERRVVYVGKIRGGMTRKELKERFSQYGEIEECTLHFRDYGDNYGFVTYYNTKDAFNAIENGSKLRQSDELPFDLCFGGRRQFCKSNYADLDSNRDYDPVPAKSRYEALDFDTLLKQAQKGQKSNCRVIEQRFTMETTRREQKSSGLQAERSATADRRAFISGVVEGFYGRPWTMEQRKELFRKEQKWGLNTYLYAPKDDYKHRMFWREMYSPEEAEQLRTLIAAAKEHGVDFVYAISPGLDMTFSNRREISTLKRKLDQVSGFGCRSFALLFDDIDAEMCAADSKVFSSSAHAQVSLTNDIFQHLREPETFMICPTDYCGTFCSPSVLESSYLRTVGDNLLPGIQVLWTGPKVVSNSISVESIEEVSKVLKRAPVIWDNIHANDYDQKMVFLGPYKGRSTDLIPRLRGVLTNPNCEFEPNFVAIHTLATWCKSHGNGTRKDVVMAEGDRGREPGREDGEGEQDVDELYSPRQALQLALTEWLEEFGEPYQYGKGPPEEPMDTDKTGCSEGVAPMQTDEEAGPYAPGPGEQPLYTAEALTLGDLELMADLFYLPYEHGPLAVAMLRELHWLRANSAILSHGPEGEGAEQAAEWRSRAKRFEDMYESVNKMYTRVCNSANRSLVYDLYPYILEIKSITSVAKEFVNWLGSHTKSPAQFLGGDQEPFSFKGGITGEFQRMLPNDGAHDLFHRLTAAPKTYSVRPYLPKDEAAVTKISRDMHNEGVGSPASSERPYSMEDRLTGGPLGFGPDHGFILEDEEGICGYALGTANAKAFLGKGEASGTPGAQEKYGKSDSEKGVSSEGAEGMARNLPEAFLARFPSLIKAQIHTKVIEPSVAKRMMGCLLSSLKTSGSQGAFCAAKQSDARMLDLYRALGCFEEVKVEGVRNDVIIMGRSL